MECGYLGEVQRRIQELLPARTSLRRRKDFDELVEAMRWAFPLDILERFETISSGELECVILPFEQIIKLRQWKQEWLDDG
jgi:hypothetical protein